MAKANEAAKMQELDKKLTAERAAMKQSVSQWLEVFAQHYITVLATKDLAKLDEFISENADFLTKMISGDNRAANG